MTLSDEWTKLLGSGQADKQLLVDVAPGVYIENFDRILLPGIENTILADSQPIDALNGLPFHLADIPLVGEPLNGINDIRSYLLLEFGQVLKACFAEKDVHLATEVFFSFFQGNELIPGEYPEKPTFVFL